MLPIIPDCKAVITRGWGVGKEAHVLYFVGTHPDHPHYKDLWKTDPIESDSQSSIFATESALLRIDGYKEKESELMEITHD